MACETASPLPAERRLWVILRWLVPVVAMVAIQLASGVPHPAHFDLNGGSDAVGASVARVLMAPGPAAVNLLHVPVFAVVAVLWCWALRPRLGAGRVYLGAGLVAGVFGAVNELSQLYVPMRMATLPDLLLDLAGVGVGLVAFSLGTAWGRRGRRG